MTKVVDLTLPIYTGLPVVPGSDREVIIKRTMTFDSKYKRNTSSLLLHSHMCTTHIDAPSHALPDGYGIDRYSLENHLIGPAYILDIRYARPGYRITVADLEAAVEKTGKPFPKGCILGINTDWTDRMWGTPEFFAQMISLEAPSVGEWLADMEPRAIVFDCYNDSWEDFFNENCFVNHIPLLEKKIPLIEFCCNMGKLHDGDWKIYALPLKITDCDAAPARVIAEAIN